MAASPNASAASGSQRLATRLRTTLGRRAASERGGFANAARRVARQLIAASWGGFAIGAAADPPIPVYAVQVVHAYPHDPAAFTEGLLFLDGFLYESTGLAGRSTIRQVELETGRVLRERKLPAELFGEGLAEWNGRLIELTWTSQTALVFDLRDFRPVGQFGYPGEGWGLTHDARDLVMSDGSAELRFLDPASFREVRRVRVTADGQPVANLNELEWVDGQILANVWQTDRIARIDPGSGRVTAWIDLGSLVPRRDGVVDGTIDVLNGIAYDADTRRLFVTGKYWPRLFEIRVVEPRSGQAR